MEKKIESPLLLALLMISLPVTTLYIQFVKASSIADWSIIPICVEPGDQDEPSISGDIITWRRAGQNGFVYDLSTGNGVSLNMRPEDVDGGLVVCTSSGDVVVYNVSADVYIPVCTNPADQWACAIDGTRVVWTDTRNGYDIYMYDLLSQVESPITESVDHESGPDISGDKIVYRKVYPGDEYANQWFVCLYDLSTGTETVIATYQTYDCWPAIDGDRVVWTDNRNGNQDIYMYTISTETVTPICIDPADQYLPSISEDIIAWSERRVDRYEVYIYNLTSHEEIQVTQGATYRHSVSNGRIVFTSSADIYLAIPERLVSNLWVETDSPTYQKEEIVVVDGGFEFETECGGAVLKVEVVDPAATTVLSTLYNDSITAVVGVPTTFRDLNSGQPFQWNTSGNHGSFKIRVTLSIESPLHVNFIEDSHVFEVQIAVISINVSTDLMAYDLGDIIHVTGNITTNGDVSNAHVKVDVTYATNGTVAANLVWNTHVSFIEDVPQTLKQINYGSDVTWTVDKWGYLKIKVGVSDGEPRLVDKTQESTTFTVNTPIDIIPPLIGAISRTPLSPSYDQDPTVTASVTDNVEVDEVILSYTLDLSWHNVSMSGTGNSYNAKIPAQSYGTIAQYRIYVNDTSNNWAVSEQHSYTIGDSMPPDVTLSQLPIHPQSGQTVTVYANVTEPVNASGLNPPVLFSYRVNSGPWVNTTMVYNGALELYESTIPQQQPNDIVEYFIQATDHAGNTGASEMVHFSVETPQPEPFPVEIVVVIGIIAVVGAVVLVYFLKSKK